MTTLDTSSLTEMQNAILQRASTLKNAAGLSTSATKDVGGVSSVVDGSKSGGILSFNDALNEAMSSVNDSYIQSTEAQDAYQKGETTDIASVMLSRQKASVAFQATLQMRNRLMDAYKTIMNMSV
ncbi:flagellar hook-basal body complex subunit FliE [Zymomonas mobilis subsp. mobilis ZM4 = ATCC 31821]|uniref:Flagellar hook-basal body complex protein FliE n=2 Tax=Zymomonas mobilis TaxID=542 RepID=D2YW31_ZYMMO|nr:flagellar hook-basal body complex protein FliE [Zymomonas mobilis]AAV89256.2 flagellar hook-basal body complex subunit FliE [Zymomonas mobilis subsp. mobilis ZM4 = ATCC 31821]ACV75178.1 flagellar hook-basal body complex subunit FliE [Zymomonas mobilis subsp. mobilis NCIMB 11163]AHB09966.1 flagellar hook-basal body complex protein FliE [Zymomonas mobilis subsp. mobilis str. CP4 = NRRL B-14023]AHJ70271.1 flagellar hook-basal body protein FliE [Zymomonas mobilis subsp. mobilis NRRL B-12526]AHJ